MDLSCRCGPGVRAGLGRVHLRPSPHSFSCSGLASGKGERTRDGTPSATQMSEPSRGLAPFRVPRKPGLFGQLHINRPGLWGLPADPFAVSLPLAAGDKSKRRNPKMADLVQHDH